VLEVCPANDHLDVRASCPRKQRVHSGVVARRRAPRAQPVVVGMLIDPVELAFRLAFDLTELLAVGLIIGRMHCGGEGVVGYGMLASGVGLPAHINEGVPKPCVVAFHGSSSPLQHGDRGRAAP
jgi:hypothetical protein